VFSATAGPQGGMTSNICVTGALPFFHLLKGSCADNILLLTISTAILKKIYALQNNYVYKLYKFLQGF
jgi:hypothetical protein